MDIDCKKCNDWDEKLLVFIVYFWLSCFFVYFKYLGGFFRFFFLEIFIKIMIIIKFVFCCCEKLLNDLIFKSKKKFIV